MEWQIYSCVVANVFLHLPLRSPVSVRTGGALPRTTGETLDLDRLDVAV